MLTTTEEQKSGSKFNLVVVDGCVQSPFSALFDEQSRVLFSGRLVVFICCVAVSWPGLSFSFWVCGACWAQHFPGLGDYSVCICDNRRLRSAGTLQVSRRRLFGGFEFSRASRRCRVISRQPRRLHQNVRNASKDRG
jgi:hypothetical protein